MADKGPEEIRRRVEQMLRLEYFAESDRDHAAVLLAAAECGRDAERVAKATGLDRKFVAPALDRLAASDFWKFDPAAGAVRPQADGWDELEPAAAVSFNIWLLVAQGTFFAEGGGDDSGPTFVAPNVFFDSNDTIKDEQ